MRPTDLSPIVGLCTLKAANTNGTGELLNDFLSAPRTMASALSRIFRDGRHLLQLRPGDEGRHPSTGSLESLFNEAEKNPVMLIKDSNDINLFMLKEILKRVSA